MNTQTIAFNSGIFKSQQGNWLMVFWLPLFAISTGTFVYFNPSFLELIITLNLWLLGYHHLVSTYSRIAFDWTSIKENWFFIFMLPIAVLLSVFGLYKTGGIVLIGSIYLYWQWYHYTRQSEGVSKAFGMKSENTSLINTSIHRFLFYMVPLLCLLMMVSRDNQMFFGSSFYRIPISQPLRMTIATLIVVFTIYAIYRILHFVKNGKLTSFYGAYMISHFFIYITSYVLIDKVTTGWLVINIWHNAQYIAIVWLFNTNKYKGGYDPKHKLISYLSQPHRLVMYILSFVLLTVLFYGLINHVSEYLIGATGLPMILIIYSTLNFHHYIVDSQIWKLRKKSVRTNLT